MLVKINKNLSTNQSLKGKDKLMTKTIQSGDPSSSSVNPGKGISTNNPFEILDGGEDRIIEPGDLLDFATKLNRFTPATGMNDDDDVEVIFDEMSTGKKSGLEQGASTPSFMGQHV
jgi:hypothetical protein